MAFRFSDGFDSYASTADLLKKWQTQSASPAATWNATAGRNGGGALQFVTVTQSIRSFNCLSAAQVNCGFWLKSTAKPTVSATILQPQSINQSNCGSIGITLNGFMCAINQTGTTQVAGALNVCDGNWHWVEVLAAYQSSGANSQCYVDGVQQWNGTITLQSVAAVPANLVLASYVQTTLTFDDLVVYDNSGVSPINSDFPLSSLQINTGRGNGDSAVQFVPDTGSTNYTQVNEVNGDTTHYVQSGNSGDQDLYDYDDLTFSPAKIWGVIANAYVHDPGVGSINHNQVCKNGSTTTTGTTTATPITNPRVIQEPFVLDPNTGAAWASAAALNTAKFGIKVT